MRSVFTPIFTSGKMKVMLKFIKLVAEDLCEEMEKKVREGEEFELRDVFGKFSLDALASSAFGVDGESFKNKDSLFVKNAANFFKFNTLENIVLFLKFMPGVPQFCEFFKINTMKPRETKFFRDDTHKFTSFAQYNDKKQCYVCSSCRQERMFAES